MLRARSRPLLIAYARLAVWLFAVVVVTGLVSALLLVPFSDLATTSYGQVLLAKLVLVAAASALAVAARRHLQRHQTPRRPAGIEAAVLAGVLALSAVLTVLPAPAQTDPSLPFAPAADGPSSRPARGPGRSASVPAPAPASSSSTSPPPRPVNAPTSGTSWLARSPTRAAAAAR
ncbi:CopD family protein [Actinacidiphila glaucinigra]|uniref:CopD family protein n=1 Tax=Actinacidiphila glaucinigra TaxID=235986 RepID=UPI003D8B4774